MNAKELRTKYIDFFVQKEHSEIPSASLISENVSSVLFTTAGMHPLVPYLMGEKHPEGNKLVNVQKCVRTGDIEEVGDATHHTFFEMLGNWSLGDPTAKDGIGAGYFKEDAIKWSWGFLTEVLKLEESKLAVSIFYGKDKVSRDEDSKKIWMELGVPKSRIAELGPKDNWWPSDNQLGPCGPDTEMFYWIGEEEAPDNFQETYKDPRWVEIWNNVFMEYNRVPSKVPSKNSRLDDLKQKNVDTGMGVERTLAVLNDLCDNYQTDLFLPIIKKIEHLSGRQYSYPERIKFTSSGGEIKSFTPSVIQDKKGEYISTIYDREMRIIADHIKAAVMILGDERGIGPSNTGAGYVLRRLIRRAVRYAKQIGITENFTATLASEVITIYQDVYPEVKNNQQFIKDELKKEEVKFISSLEKTIPRKNKRIEIIKRTLKGDKESGDKKWIQHDSKIANNNAVDIWDKTTKKSSPIVIANSAFVLESTYGYPHDLFFDDLKSENLLKNKIITNKVENFFWGSYNKHQELSRTASAGQFKGGLADASEETKKLHTVAHLMLEAMRQVLGGHVQQKGSNINAERLRFDFSHDKKLTNEQKEKIEEIVNEQIKADLPVKFEEMTLDEARKLGATGVFDSKYGEKVKVYSVGEFSKEICGGPHVEHTGELGKFKIKKEQSSSAGVRRIKAILE